jgi:hypothetical protein
MYMLVSTPDLMYLIRQHTYEQYLQSKRQTSVSDVATCAMSFTLGRLREGPLLVLIIVLGFAQVLHNK